MVAMFKAIPFGIILTLLVALFMGSGGTSGGMLNIFEVQVDALDGLLNFDFYWSWMLFLAGTGLAFVFVLMMGD